MVKVAVKKKSNKRVIRLNKSAWTINLDAPLGPPGGFGEVFHGTGEDGREVAIKKLKLEAAEVAHREMRIGEFLLDRPHKHIVPVLDVGQDADSDGYYLVMPICDGSLQQEIEKRNPFSPEESIKILLNILSGLEEAKDLTHRDIKPSNILLHEGVWKVADFGIAKFVEESTSLRTLKEGLTPLYAAPEQWELKASTAATDIYAVGCIAHTLVTGAAPFSGAADQLRERHISGVPAQLPVYPDSVRSLVNQMLRKPQALRPSRKRCIEVFSNAGVPIEKKGYASLASAVTAVSAEQAKREADEVKKREQAAHDKQVFEAAVAELKTIKNELFKIVRANAQGLLQKSNSDASITLGGATLEWNTDVGSKGIEGCKIKHDAWFGHTQGSSWDFVALGKIVLRGKSGSQLCSANLIFGRPNNQSDYRWWEIAFFAPFGASQNGPAPFAENDLWEIDQAFSAMHSIAPAYRDGPVSIDGEDSASFIEYWIDLLAKAATNSYQAPRYIPIER